MFHYCVGLDWALPLTYIYVQLSETYTYKLCCICAALLHISSKDINFTDHRTDFLHFVNFLYLREYKFL